MADALLEIVIRNLGSFIQEELATFLGVGELTQRLSRNLTAIRVVLKDAEEKQIKSHAVKDWLQNLSDAAYVLDDILDECLITSKAHVDNKWITRFRPKKYLARRDIGKRMIEIAKRIDDIAIEITEENQRGDDEWRLTTSVITIPKVYGRDRDREQVVECLLKHAVDSEELSVYSIVGIGEIGKTTLAQVVFNDERVNTHFDLKIWVCVSNDFSMMKLLDSIIESTIGKNPYFTSLESMQNMVRETLRNKRYLLVLDDVWSEDQEKWNKFKSLLPSGNGSKGASILVTTRLDTVASIMGIYPAYHLVGLSDDDIWSLFEYYAFRTNIEDRAELVAIGKEIVRKCAGSPIVAKILGSRLRFKSNKKERLFVKDYEFSNLPEYKPMMSALRLSYLNLQLSSRSCFTFCAVFPKDFEMVKEQLIHLWMANGFITSRGNLEMEHFGNKVWNELYQRSFFQEVKSDEVGNITFKMRGLFHNLAQSIMREECMAFEVSSMTNLSSRIHHISCFNTKGEFDYNMIPFKKVESLRTFLEFKPPSNNLDVLPSVTSLRALRTSSFELSALKNLIHLRYLELYESKIVTLPDSICGLLKLQTLKLARCNYLSSFPKRLTQLQDLRHLVIKDCQALVSTPFRIGELTCLKTLTDFIVGSEIGFGLAELKNLQLGGKLHIRGLENVSNKGDAREANMIGKKNLNRLYLSWGDYVNSQVRGVDAEGVLDALEPRPGLRSFGVKGYQGKNFPPWMRSTTILKSLVVIILYDCKNCMHLPPLGKLPCLTTLYVCGMKDLKCLDDDSYEPATEKAFTSLKKLTLCDLPNLERVLLVEGVEMLTQLSNLSISCVPKLALPYLPSVELLSARGGTEVLLKFISYKNCNVDVASSPRFIAGNSMYNLKSLYISDSTKLKELPDELGTLCALEHLHIQFCDEMESFSKKLLHGLSSLKTLTVNHCHGFKSLSEGIRHLTCLERLQITYCPQFIFPHNMNSQTSLRQLKVSGHNKNILDGIEGIPSLQNLSLTYFVSLTSLPEWLGAMTSLQELQISGFPKLSSLPDSFQQLQNLKKLSIASCSKLETRCEKEIGEDWHKIAHIPEIELESNFDAKPTFGENITSEWKMGNQFWHRPKFESMVEML